MHEQPFTRFRTEIRHFFTISILNIVFAALAIASGVQYIAAAVLGLTAGPAMTDLRILIGAVALACFGLGIRWLLSTVRVFTGVREIRDKLDAEGTTVTDERVTCLIVQMLAHYRKNRRTILTMIRVCTLGGVCFFALGIATSLEALSVTSGGFAFTLDNYLVIPAMLITLGIAFASLLSSYYFSKFARVWDRRLHEIGESECALKKSLGLDEQ
jgi:uncharacterized membrane protein